MKKVYPERIYPDLFRVPSRKYSRGSRRGFTLIEMLVVIFIIGTVSASLVFGARAYLPTWHIYGSSRVLVNQLRQAQEDAVTTQHQHLLRFSPTSSPVTYQYIKIDSGETVLENLRLPDAVGLTLDPSFTNNQVIFSADGGPNTSGNLILSKEDKTKTINISPAGVIKIL